MTSQGSTEWELGIVSEEGGATDLHTVLLPEDPFYPCLFHSEEQEQEDHLLPGLSTDTEAGAHGNGAFCALFLINISFRCRCLLVPLLAPQQAQPWQTAKCSCS